MDDEPAATDADAADGSAPQNSVFSNLPASRPGARSPRRDRAQAVKTTAKQTTPARAKATTKPKAAVKPKAVAKPAGTQKPSQPRPERESGPAPEPPRQRSGAGLEDLAWAGVAAAAEAATLGVRLATKAIDALRQNADRR